MRKTRRWKKCWSAANSSIFCLLFPRRPSKKAHLPNLSLIYSVFQPRFRRWRMRFIAADAKQKNQFENIQKVARFFENLQLHHFAYSKQFCIRKKVTIYSSRSCNFEIPHFVIPFSSYFFIRLYLNFCIFSRRKGRVAIGEGNVEKKVFAKCQWGKGLKFNNQFCWIFFLVITKYDFLFIKIFSNDWLLAQLNIDVKTTFDYVQLVIGISTFNINGQSYSFKFYF